MYRLGVTAGLTVSISGLFSIAELTVFSVETAFAQNANGGGNGGGNAGGNGGGNAGGNGGGNAGGNGGGNGGGKGGGNTGGNAGGQSTKPDKALTTPAEIRALRASITKFEALVRQDIENLIIAKSAYAAALANLRDVDAAFSEVGGDLAARPKNAQLKSLHARLGALLQSSIESAETAKRNLLKAQRTARDSQRKLQQALARK